MFKGQHSVNGSVVVDTQSNFLSSWVESDFHFSSPKVVSKGSVPAAAPHPQAPPRIAVQSEVSSCSHQSLDRLDQSPIVSCSGWQEDSWEASESDSDNSEDQQWISEIPQHSPPKEQSLRGVEERKGQKYARLGAPNLGGVKLSWKELEDLGLNRALDEYYKMTASMNAAKAAKKDAARGAFNNMLAAILAPEFPKFCELPSLVKAIGSLASLIGTLFLQLAPVILPLILCNFFSAFHIVEPHRLISSDRFPFPTSRPLAAAVLAGGLVAFWLLEKAAVTRKRAQIHASRTALTPESFRSQVAAAGQGYVPVASLRGRSKEASPAAASTAGPRLGAPQEDPGVQLELLRGQIQAVKKTLYGADGAPAALGLPGASFEEMAKEVKRLCTTVGVKYGEEEATTKSLMSKIQEVAKSIG